MLSRASKLRLRRGLRIRKRQVEAFGAEAERQLELNFFRRLERLVDVRRFVISWLMLAVLLGACLVVQIRALSGYYQTLQPVPGGTYTEGIVGSLTNVNPIYAANSVDQAVSKLIFSGLYTYNDKNQLVGDLASGPWTVDSAGLTYTVHLRPNLKWQDGESLTSNDVAFTYQVIQNSDAQSPLNSSWQGVKVAAPDPLTVTFTLPDPLSSFPYSLTNGIVPKHILGSTSMTDMRTASFNTSNPVGSGPFMWQTVEVSGSTPETRQQQVALKPFEGYYGGAAKVDSFVVRTFRDQAAMVNAFKSHELTAMAGLDSMPANLKKDDSIYTYDFPLTAAVMTFFRTTQPIMNDVQVRQALVKATDVPSIISSLGYPTKAVDEPLLKGQLGYDINYAQAPFDLSAAQAQLTADGWKPGSDDIRTKDGQRLTFKLAAEDTSEYRKVATQLATQWRKAGVDVQVDLQNTTDFQTTLTNHSYDALLYGISIGTDPDVYPYWATAQTTNRLNFSEYSSKVADSALQSARTRSDPALRLIKYRPFLQTWHDDAPAVGLYQPRVFYITRGPVAGIKEHTINAATDRYFTVNQWMIRRVNVTQSETDSQQ